MTTSTPSSPDRDSADHAIRVLAIGDSAAFGMYLEQANSYPSQLEKLWNEQHPENPLEVINLGYPGTSSYRVAHNMSAALSATCPDIVLLSVGINDIFGTARYVQADTSPVTEQTRGNSLPGFATVERRDLLCWSDDMEERHSRVKAFKAANTNTSQGLIAGCETMTYAGQTLVTIAGEDSGDKSGQEKGFQCLQHNLGHIHREVQASGAQLYLLSYGANSSLYHPANREIGNYAKGRADLQFVDVATAFTDADSNSPPDGEALLFEDLHPTAAGYELMAEIVAIRLKTALL